MTMTEEQSLLEVRRTPSDLTITKADVNGLRRVELLKNGLSIATNVFSVVGIVLVNKIIFSHYNFPFGIFLTIIHFSVTFLILLLLSKIEIFEIKRLPWNSVLLLSASFCGFVVLTNLSLKYNSVAFYQMIKVLTTPIVAVIQFFGYGIRMGGWVKITLGLTCIGVLGATAKEVTVSPVGTLIALFSVLITAFYQVLVGAKQKDLKADSMQLLTYQAPFSAVMLMMCCTLFERPSEIVSFPAFSTGLVIAILGSSVLAALVNVSTFLIIGQTSAITYNVVGHCKLCLVLLFGFIMFDHQSLSLVNLLGLAVALAGILSYSYVKITKH